MNNCKDCKFWKPGNGEMGVCAFNPPKTSIVLVMGMDNKPAPVALTHWPETRPSDGCGQFSMSASNLVQ